MHILRLPLPDLGLLYHVEYDNKSGTILCLRVFANNNKKVLEELYIEKDFSIEYYMKIYYEMLNYIKSTLISK